MAGLWWLPCTERGSYRRHGRQASTSSRIAAVICRTGLARLRPGLHRRAVPGRGRAGVPGPGSRSRRASSPTTAPPRRTRTCRHGWINSPDAPPSWSARARCSTARPGCTRPSWRRCAMSPSTCSLRPGPARIPRAWGRCRRLTRCRQRARASAAGLGRCEEGCSAIAAWADLPPIPSVSVYTLMSIGSAASASASARRKVA